MTYKIICLKSYLFNLDFVFESKLYLLITLLLLNQT